MSNTTVTYRTNGSAALKPEYIEDRAKVALIIDFESLAGAPARQRIYRAPHKQTLSEKVAKAVCSDPLLGSLDKAFIAAEKKENKGKVAFVHCVAGISLVYLALILLGL